MPPFFSLSGVELMKNWLTWFAVMLTAVGCTGARGAERPVEPAKTTPGAFGKTVAEPKDETPASGGGHAGHAH